MSKSNDLQERFVSPEITFYVHVFFFCALCVSQQSYQDGCISAVHMWLFINRQRSLALTRLMGSLALSNLMF